MKLFTFKELDEIAYDGHTTPEDDKRLVEHARELLRLKSEPKPARGCLESQIFKQPRESNLAVALDITEARAVIREHEAVYFELVSMAVSEPGFILHFRKP